MNTKSILIIGASGRTGNYIIQQLNDTNVVRTNTNKPKIYAFCRDPSKLHPTIMDMCDGTIKGNARSSDDLERALVESQADLVLVSVGNGDSVKKSDIRTQSAQALVKVLTKNSGNTHTENTTSFENVRVIVVSSSGAGGSKIKVGFGIGKLIEWHLRHVLNDHNGQEAAFMGSRMMKNRTMIVRPTALTENEATGYVLTFGEKEKCPTLQTDRKDLADWLIREGMMSADRYGSAPVCLTCIKPKK